MSVFSTGFVLAATPSLHTSGSSIVDANGNVVYLRGVGIAGMAPDLVLWENGGSDTTGATNGTTTQQTPWTKPSRSCKANGT
jgi:hypothetical protein